MKQLEVHMIGLDTNVLVRYLVEDDEGQHKKAVTLIDSYAGKKSSIFINNIVICELIWVLERAYHYQKTQLIPLLKDILATVEFSFEDHKILWMSMLEYETVGADFSDILISNLNITKSCTNSFTFDKKASNLQSFTIIE